MGQSWSVQADGGYVTVPHLTELIRVAAQEAQGMAQLANPPDEENLGKGAGDTVYYIFVKNVANEGGALSESQPVPETKMTVVRSSFTITEYGNSLTWTGKLEDLANLPVEHPFVRGLINDIRKVENTAVYTKAITTDYKARVNHASNSTIEFVTNGTLTGQALADPDWAALMRLVAEAEDINIPYWDGESYVYVTGKQAITKLRLDSNLTNFLKEDSGRAALNGEIGRVAGCIVVKDNHKIDKTAGASAFNEGVLFGADAVQQQIGLPWEIRREVTDMGRNKKVGYYGIMGWHKMLDMTDHTEEHIIHVSST